MEVFIGLAFIGLLAMCGTINNWSISSASVAESEARKIKITKEAEIKKAEILSVERNQAKMIDTMQKKDDAHHGQTNQMMENYEKRMDQFLVSNYELQKTIVDVLISPSINALPQANGQMAISAGPKYTNSLDERMKVYEFCEGKSTSIEECMDILLDKPSNVMESSHLTTISYPEIVVEMNNDTDTDNTLSNNDPSTYSSTVYAYVDGTS